jgi:hypothetical protein
MEERIWRREKGKKKEVGESCKEMTKFEPTVDFIENTRASICCANRESVTATGKRGIGITCGGKQRNGKGE